MNRISFARKCYLESAKILFAFLDEQRKQLVESPRIIMPGEPLVQKAVDLLLKLDPNYFRGASEIKVKDMPAYGQVESGPGKDPYIIYLNVPRAKLEITQKIKNQNPSATQVEIDEAIAKSLAATIAHERAHLGKSPEEGFKPESEATRVEAEIFEKIK